MRILARTDHRGERILRALLAVWTVLFVLAATAIVSRADSTGTVTGSTVNVRKEPSTSADKVASVSRGDTVTIKSQTSGADGYTWYEVSVGTTTGYIRSDFVSITDGSTPATTTTTVTPATGTASAANTDGMTAYNPVSAKVTGGQSVRVRSDATTNAQIITTLQKDHELTVSGSKTLTDGHTWYYVTFTKDNTAMSGYIREEYVALSGELVAAGGDTAPDAGEPQADPSDTGDQPADPETEDTSADVSKPYEVQLQTDATDGVEKWFLLDKEGNLREDGASYAYGIEKLFEERDTNTKTIAEQKKKLRTARAWMVVFLILMIAAVCAAVFFFLKWRDLGDQAAFAEAERSRRNRAAQRTGNGSGNARPQGGQRPAGSGQRPGQGSGTRTQRPGQGAQGGQRSGASNGGGQRPAGSNQRPQGSQNGGQAARPQGGSERSGESRTEQASSRGESSAQGTQHPQGSSQRPAQSQRPQQSGKSAKSRNLADDDDEFEFGFLNYEDD